MGFLRQLGISSSVALSKASRFLSSTTDLPVPVGRRMSEFAEAAWISNAVKYKDKPWGLSYDVLRTLSIRDSVIAAIITTRVRQVSTFSRPASITHDRKGFLIRHRDVRHSPSPAERKLVEKYERFFAECGRTDTPRDRFNALIKKVLRDCLVHDQLVLEDVYDRKGELAEFYAVDGASIRLRYDEKERTPNGFVQLLDGRPWMEFEPEQMVFAVDNPRTDLRVAGYGMSGIEQIINIVTSHLFAEEVNKRRIQPGVQLDGLLWSEGSEMTFEMLESLRRAWQAQAQGVIGTGHLAAINMPQGSKLNYIPLHKQINDMEWARWIDYMINVASAIFAIDPSEINFPNRGGPAQSTPLFETGHEARLMYSKDKGLRPLLNFLEEAFTEGILWRLPDGKDFLFEFVGIDSRTREQESDVARKEVSTFVTVNEYRKAHDMPALPGGDVILDPIYMQSFQAEQTQEQGGMPGGVPGGGPPGGEVAPPGAEAPAEGGEAAPLDIEGILTSAGV